MTKNRILYVIIRDRTGAVMHQAIGSAILEADSDARLTTLALREGIEPLATFGDYSPAEAEHAKQTLADLGDVEFDDADFEPHWHEPASCINAIDGLIGLGRKASRFLSSDVRSELACLRATLEEASQRSCDFYLVDVEPGEEIDFAGSPLQKGAE